MPPAAVPTYRAAINVTTQKVEVQDRKLPELGPFKVLVRMEAAGICASDLHLTRKMNPYLTPTVETGGHEGVGRIAAMGNDVDQDVWKINDRVAVRWLHYVCLKCELCLSGNEPLCNDRVLGGLNVEGCWGEYAVADGRYLLRVPEGISAIQAAPILCAGVTVYKALKVASLAPQSWVALVGAGGGLGHLAIQYAKVAQLRVLAIDGGAEKGKLSKALGADVYLDYLQAKDLTAEIIDITQGGAHGVLVLNSNPKAYEQAVTYVRKAGVLMCVGITPVKMTLPVGPEYFIGRGIQFKGTSLGTLEDAKEALEYLAQGKVKPVVVEKRIEDISSCLDALEEGEGMGRFVVNFR